MKKNYFLFTVFMLFSAFLLNAQNVSVKQVIVVSGGNFSDPDDYVTIGSYNPVDSTTTQFGTIYTQAVQCAVVYDHFLYVAAQDSIVAFDINSYQRVAAIEAPAVNQLYATEEKLIVSFWYPSTSDFVKIYDRSDLSEQAVISEVSGEAAGIAVYENRAYIAVPGSYGNTTGKLAVIDLNTNSFLNELDLGEEGARINDVYVYQTIYKGIQDAYLITINKSEWGANTGYIMKYNLSDDSYSFSQVEVNIGKGAGIDPLNGGTLYAIINGGVGTISLQDLSVVDTSVVESSNLSIADAEYDIVNKLIYVTKTDYFSTGYGSIYNLQGDSIGTFDAGISAEAIAVDYRNNTYITDVDNDNDYVIYPNPAVNRIYISNKSKSPVSKVVITNLTGQVVFSGVFDNMQQTALDISGLKSGIYLVSIFSDESIYSSKIIKK